MTNGTQKQMTEQWVGGMSGSHPAVVPHRSNQKVQVENNPAEPKDLWKPFRGFKIRDRQCSFASVRREYAKVGYLRLAEGAITESQGPSLDSSLDSSLESHLLSAEKY